MFATPWALLLIGAVGAIILICVTPPYAGTNGARLAICLYLIAGGRGSMRDTASSLNRIGLLVGLIKSSLSGLVGPAPKLLRGVALRCRSRIGNRLTYGFLSLACSVCHVM